MELLLVGVTVVSLLLAMAMSAFAWTLLRRERQRSAARIEALEALAFEAERAAEEPRAARMSAPPVHETDVLDFPDADEGAVTPAEAPVLVPRTQALSDWDLPMRSGAAPRVEVEHAPRAAAVSAPARVAELPDGMFGSVEHAAGPTSPSARRWLALAAVVLLVAAGFVIVSALRSPEMIAAIAASRSGASATGAHPLELLSLRHAIDKDGSLTVTGLVEDPPDGVALEKVSAVVYLFDENGHYFAEGHAALDVNTFRPGDESPFSVTIPNAASVHRYRVGFRRGDGLVVAHVDRRGQLPAGTTGDAVGDVAPVPASTVGAAKPGSYVQ